jgi:hypothetical protein
MAAGTQPAHEVDMRTLLLIPALLLLACAPEVIVSNTTSSGGNGGNGASGGSGGSGASPACPFMAPIEGASCDLPDYAECYYESGTVGCSLVYLCEPVYPEAGAPSVWLFNGTTGTCSCPTPSCDPGDTPALDPCGEDEGCYTVANECGAATYCVDDAYPEHGCPPVEPVFGSACADVNKFCTYPLGDDCVTFYACQGAQGWQPAGGGCTGSSGSG